MSKDFSKAQVKSAVAKILLEVGWSTSDLTPLEVLTDICVEHLGKLARLTNRNANEYNSSSPSVRHLEMAMDLMSVKVEELNEYVVRYGGEGSALEVPRYPVAMQDDLNFLKPGSVEVLTRPLHIFDYLPPIPRDSAAAVEAPKHTPKSEYKVNPTRSMASIMMTSSGFISASKRGVLPTRKARKPCRKSRVSHKSTKKLQLSCSGTSGMSKHLDRAKTKLKTSTPSKKKHPKVKLLKEIKREIRDLFKSDIRHNNDTIQTNPLKTTNTLPSTSKLLPESSTNPKQSEFNAKYEKILSTFLSPSQSTTTKKTYSPCPGCSKEDDGSLMIACDICDTWYHYSCADIEPPFDVNCDDWYCKFCVLEYSIVKSKTQ